MVTIITGTRAVIFLVLVKLVTSSDYFDEVGEETILAIIMGEERIIETDISDNY